MSQDKFKIILDQVPQTIYPGDVVSGKVVLHSPEDEEVFDVTINFCAFLFFTLRPVPHD